GCCKRERCTHGALRSSERGCCRRGLRLSCCQRACCCRVRGQTNGCALRCLRLYQVLGCCCRRRLSGLQVCRRLGSCCHGVRVQGFGACHHRHDDPPSHNSRKRCSRRGRQLQERLHLLSVLPKLKHGFGHRDNAIGNRLDRSGLIFQLNQYRGNRVA